MIPQVILCLFVFGKKSKIPKKTFRNWHAFLLAFFYWIVYFKINQNMSSMNYIQFWKHARMKLFLKIVIFFHILKSTLGFKDMYFCLMKLPEKNRTFSTNVYPILHSFVCNRQLQWTFKVFFCQFFYVHIVAKYFLNAPKNPKTF